MKTCFLKNKLRLYCWPLILYSFFVLCFWRGDDSEVVFSAQTDLSLQNRTADTSDDSLPDFSDRPKRRQTSEQLRETEVRLRQDWERKLGLLLDKCDQYKMPLEKEISRRFLARTKENGYVIAKITNQPTLARLPDDAGSFQVSWHKAMRRLRSETATGYFQLGEQYLTLGKGYEAFRLFRLALSIDSDQSGARRRFGYTFLGGLWLAPWECKQQEKGLVEHSKFGWIPKENTDRYERGERLLDRQWLTVEDDTALRRSKHIGWKAETEHYILATEYSLEEAVRISRLLEDFYQAWMALFYQYAATESQWTAAFRKNCQSESQKHKIFLFSNREDYLREVRKLDKTGNVERSHGGYFPEVRCIYAYIPSPEEKIELDVMLVHEATHQLMEECRPKAGSARRRKYSRKAPVAQNYWCLEGCATYMETFKDDGRNFYLGGLNSDRLLRARERVAELDGYMPLKQYTELSQQRFQSHKDIPMLYTQAAGLTLFFLHYNDGVFSNAFAQYLDLVYDRLDQRDSLEQLTGQSFEQLDRSYKNFLRALPIETPDFPTAVP